MKTKAKRSRAARQMKTSVPGHGVRKPDGTMEATIGAKQALVGTRVRFLLLSMVLSAVAVGFARLTRGDDLLRGAVAACSLLLAVAALLRAKKAPIRAHRTRCS